MKTLAAFDLDGTLLTQNSSFALVRYLTKAGVFTRLQYTLCATLYVRHTLFRMPLLALHEQVLRILFWGLSVEMLQQHLRLFLDRHLKPMLYLPAAEALKKRMQNGEEVGIFSASPSFIVGPIAERLGVQRVVATSYHTDQQGCLRGVQTLVDGNHKRLYLNDLKNTVSTAYSDSYLDLPFLEAANKAVAVNPDRRLRRVAQKLRWEIL